MKHSVEFVEPGRNWNLELWQNSYVRYVEISKKNDDGSLECFLSFLEYCSGKFLEKGLTKTANQLSQIRDTIFSMSKNEVVKSNEGVVLAKEFMSRFDGMEDDSVKAVVELLQAKTSDINCCHIQNGRWRLKVDVAPANAPCDYCEIKDVFHFKGMWFLVGEKLWRSRDAISWEEVRLERFQDYWYSAYRFSASQDTLFMWRGGGATYAFTTDGITWAYGTLPIRQNNAWLANFFCCAGRWYAQVKSLEFYHFKKKMALGLLSADDSVGYSVTYLYSTCDLRSEWEMVDEVLPNDYEFFSEGALAVSGDAMVGIVSSNEQYAKQMGVAVKGARFVVYSNGVRYDARCCDKIQANFLGEVKACFKEYAGAVYCACDHNGLFVSKDHGKSWSQIWRHGTIGLRLHEVCGVLLLCGWSGLYGFDGATCNKFSLNQKVEVISFAEHKALFVDRRTNGGGLFLGEFRLERDGLD